MALEIRDLTAGYGDITVLRGISFTIPSDGIEALLGANGAGKTTSLNAISGLHAQITAGTITLDGEPVTNMPAHKRVAAGIAHVPQGRQLFSFMSVRENLEMGTYLRRTHVRQRETLDWLLEKFPRLKERLSQDDDGRKHQRRAALFCG